MRCLLPIVAIVVVVTGCAPRASAASPSPTAQPASAASPAPTTRSATADEIERLQAVIDAEPTDVEAQRDLGFALLQRVRETADPALYGRADVAFERAPFVIAEDFIDCRHRHCFENGAQFSRVLFAGR